MPILLDFPVTVPPTKSARVENIVSVVDLAVADFYIEIQAAATVADLLTLHHHIDVAVMKLQAVQDAASERINRPSRCVVTAKDYEENWK